MAEETKKFKTDTSVHDYHVYWMPVIGEQLACEREKGNPRDQYVKKVVTYAIGHVLHNISTLCSLFIRPGGTILGVISGWH